MDFPRPYRLGELAAFLHCELRGDAEQIVSGLNEIHRVRSGDLVFVDHPKYYDKALQSAATVVLIDRELDCPEGKGLLISADPFRDFNRLAAHFRPFVAAQAQVAASAQIGEGSIVQPGCFIGEGVRIGKNCIIHANVIIYDQCEIGDEVVIHAGCVLGADAFYYQKRDGQYQQMHSSGRVVLEDWVHLGAACTIDRGVSDETRIGAGSKLDNQVHIGHDTRLGKNCLLASQVGVAGCVTLEDEVILWGQVGVTSNVTIGAKAVVLAQAGVAKSLAGGRSYFGYPAEEARKKYREMASLRLLPQIIERL